MAIPAKGEFVTLENAKIWFKESTNEIHLTINDDDLNHPDTEPGMRVVFSVNPKSANYHPANYNRCAEVLRQHGKNAPAENAPEGNRRLDKRNG